MWIFLFIILAAAYAAIVITVALLRFCLVLVFLSMSALAWIISLGWRKVQA